VIAGRDVLRCRPVLSNVYAGELLAADELAEVDARLQDAQRWLEPHAATLRTHTRTIYSKLGVNNRRAAVRRAEELLRK
jgi:hypothetical protein